MNTNLDATRLTEWLTPLNPLPLNCGELTFALVMLLDAEDIPHRHYVGSLELRDVGTNLFHYWIELEGGLTIDFRARTELGPSAPHGVFRPTAAQRYAPRRLVTDRLDNDYFDIMTKRRLADYPRYRALANIPVDQASNADG